MLVLLDIDGTLLLGRPLAHTEALAAATRDVYGVPADAGDIAAIAPAGRTDREILRLVLERHGVGAGPARERVGEWMGQAVALYPSLAPRFPDPAPAPGAAAALEAMARDGLSLALLTGNLEPIAHAKVGAAGLGGWLPEGRGAFGSDDERREALVPVARERHGAPDEVVVVGDTPRDIACARAGGARCVAVTTGVHDAAALGAADAIAEGLEQAAEVIRGWAQSPRAAAARS